MLYNDLTFWIYFIPAALLYWFLPLRFQNVLLLIGSYSFYASWEPIFVSILFISSLTDFFAGKFAAPPQSKWIRQVALATSLCINFGILLVFKYFNFFTADILQTLGLREGISAEALKIALPVGISFYTLQTVSYTIDCYRGKMKPHPSLHQFLIYVAYFPQLLAGPIERGKKLIPQIENPRSLSSEAVQLGVSLILLGLFKKVFVSGFFVSQLTSLGDGNQLQGPLLIVAGLLMTLIVYCDFGGYCDMARGMSKLLGIDITINFRPFYYAKSPQEFWSRWNITLGTWVRDYLILPFRNKSLGAGYHSLLIIVAMILVGLWHAPKWSWFLFGLFHGLALVGFQQLSKTSFWQTSRPLRLAFGLPFMIVLYVVSGLLHFSGETTEGAKIFLNITEGWELLPWAATVLMACFTAYSPLLVFEFFQEKRQDYDFLQKTAGEVRLIFLLICLLGLAAGMTFEQTSFIYYRF